MQTKREYAASLGLAKAGARGKFSNAAKEAIAKAEAEGMKFSDTSTAPKPAPTGGETPAAPAPTKPGDSAYLSPADFRYPEAEYVAVARDANGKRILHGMRECCNTCKVSLTNHMCNTPTIHGNVVVKIEKR